MRFPSRRPLFLVLLALWLPFQSAIAFAMPFCGHLRPTLGAAPSGGSVHVGHHDQAPHTHHDHGVIGSMAADDGAAPEPLGTCDQCGLCHLACAGFIAPTASASGPMVPTHVLISAILPAVTNPHLDLLDRPPLTAA